MLKLIVFLPVVLILLQVVAIYLQTQRLLQIRFRYPRYEVQPLRDLPSDLRQVLKPTVEQLQHLGFKFCGTYRIQKMVHFDQADDQAMLLYHPQCHTFAELEVRWPADGSDLTTVNFYQVFEGGSWLLTMNGQAHGIIASLPDTIITDPYCASLAAQWQHHQQKTAEIDRPSRVLKPAAFLSALQKLQQRYVDILLAEKRLVIRRGMGGF
ncbi:MAG: hypothetical protein HC805_06770 [Alkalinema sp. RL_2_19]|nr:hypothetical protein [Alkalinema sp. RL_2_19]